MLGISRRELARRVGVSETSVRKKIDDGTLVAALNRDGSLNPAMAERLLAGAFIKGPVPVQLKSARARHNRALVHKLMAEVDELRRTFVPVSAIAPIIAVERDRLRFHLNMVPVLARAAAGRSAADAAMILRNVLFDALEANAADPPPETPWWDDPIEPPRPDPSTLTPALLSAAKLDLAAAKIEIENAVNSGELADVQEAAKAWEESLAVAKSLLISMSGRLAASMFEASPDDAEKFVRAEVESALAEL